MVDENLNLRVLRKGKDFKESTKLRIKIIRLTGNLLVLIGLVGLIFTFWPLFSAELPYRLSKIRGQKFSVDLQQKSEFGEILTKQQNLIVPKSLAFGLVVEKINANAPVIANVNPFDEKEYKLALKKGVAHAAGTVLPGQNGVSFLFAHSTLNPWDIPRYNAVFYLLRELETGDRIVTYYDGKRYDYTVYDKKVVNASDVQYLTMEANEPILILQTCDPPGTTWRRLLVFAKLNGS